MWVVSVDSVGNLLWQRSLGGSNTDHGTSLVVLHDSSIVASGYSFSFDGDVPFNFGGQDAWIVYLSLDGDLLLSHTYGGSDHDGGYYLIQDSTKNILVNGITS